MFTGIIEHTGTIEALLLNDDGGRVTIHAPSVAPSLAVSHSLAVIPYTYEHTNIRDRKPGDAVNLEGDVIGKYVERYLQAGQYTRQTTSQLTVARLIEEGF